MDLETEKFTYYLDECYFHSERDKEFLTETEKQLARKAMELLWNKPNITVNGEAGRTTGPFASRPRLM